MPPTVRSPEAAHHDRMAAAIMVAHFLLQLGSGLLGAGIFVGLGGMVSVLGAVEKELGAIAFGGFFGGIGVLLGIFLLVQAIPAALAAWGLWRGSSWRQAAALVASMLAMTHVPVGTGLALGTLFFLYKAHQAEQAAA